MAYNNGFPMNYQNAYQYQQPYQQYQQMQPQYIPQQQYTHQTQYAAQQGQNNQQVNNLPMQQQNAFIPPKFDIVQGELAANMYPTENGQEIILIDTDNPCVYKKKRGFDGKLEPMITFDLVERKAQPAQEIPKINLDEYVREDEIAGLIADAVKDEVEKRLADITLKPSTRKSKSEE